jgi:tripartite-type tricarboxylate transporter receptor subunit TctC
MHGEEAMTSRTALFGIALALALVPFTPSDRAAAQADKYPSKPINLIVPNAPSGSSDLIARIMQTKLGEALGQPIVIQNRPGAGGNIGWAQLVKSQPDGYTIGLGNSRQFVINYIDFDNLTFGPQDIVPVSLVGETPYVLAAHPSLPAKTLKELIEYARANPKAIRYGAQGTRNLAMHHIQNDQRVAMIEVPYGGGSGPIMNDLLGGHIQLTAATTSSVIGHFRSGKLRPIAIMSRERSSELPDVPTTAEAGFPQFVNTLWFGIALPAKTPAPIVNTMHQALQKTMSDPGVRQQFQKQALTAKTNASPAEFQKYVDSEMIRWRQVANAIDSQKKK